MSLWQTLNEDEHDYVNGSKVQYVANIMCCQRSVVSPFVCVEYEEELVFTEVFRHSKGLNLCKTVPQDLTHARLSYSSPS